MTAPKTTSRCCISSKAETVAALSVSSCVVIDSSAESNLVYIGSSVGCRIERAGVAGAFVGTAVRSGSEETSPAELEFCDEASLTGSTRSSRGKVSAWESTDASARLVIAACRATLSGTGERAGKVGVGAGEEEAGRAPRRTRSSKVSNPPGPSTPRPRGL